jgi:hypothetical protein
VVYLAEPGAKGVVWKRGGVSVSGIVHGGWQADVAGSGGRVDAAVEGRETQDAALKRGATFTPRNIIGSG